MVASRSPGFLHVAFNGRQMAEIASALGATEQQFQRAAVRGLNDTIKWLASQSAKAVSAETGIAQKHIRRRLRTNRRATLTKLRSILWIGLYPMKAGYLGTPRQGPRGTRAGKRFFEGAFAATMRSGHVGVFRRSGHTKRWTRGRPRTSSPNLPIEEQMVPLEPMASKAIEALLPQVEDQVLTRTYKHLEYEVFIRGR